MERMGDYFYLFPFYNLDKKFSSKRVVQKKLKYKRKKKIKALSN